MEAMMIREPQGEYRPSETWFPPSLYKGGTVTLPQAVFYLPKELGISPQAAWLFVTLFSMRRSNGIYPSVSTLCERLNVCRDSVIRWIKELEKTGLIKVERQWGKRSRYNLKPSFKILESIARKLSNQKSKLVGESDQSEKSTSRQPVENSDQSGGRNFRPEQLNNNISNTNKATQENIYIHAGEGGDSSDTSNATPQPRELPESAEPSDEADSNVQPANSSSNGDSHPLERGAACHHIPEGWHEVIDRFMDLVGRSSHPVTLGEKDWILKWQRMGVTPEMLDRAIDLVFQEHPEKRGDRRTRIGYLDYKVQELLEAKRRRDREEERRRRLCKRCWTREALEFGYCAECERVFVERPDDFYDQYPKLAERLKALKRKIAQARGWKIPEEVDSNASQG